MHLGYATQWFAFAFLSFMLWLKLSLKRADSNKVQGQHLMKSTKSKYLTLTLLILLFGLPPAVGWIYIMNPQWLPDSHKNRGTLVSPPRPLNTLALKDENSRPFNWATISGRWTLVSHNSGHCDEQCQQQISMLQQIRRAVGSERIRVERLLIQDLPTGDSTVKILNEKANGARILYLEADKQAAFNKLFSISGLDHRSATYLIDPNGMLMMGHDASNATKDILKDLEILLKASSNWAKGVNNGHG